jgi:uncharacterized phage infection (PIP) family protein YhgE
MGTNEYETRTEATGRNHRTAAIALGVGLAVALAGDGYLLVRSNHLNDEMANMQAGTQTQISKLNEATTTLLQQEQARLDQIAQQIKQDVKGVSDSASVAIRRARQDAEKSGQELSSKIAEQQQQIASELTQIRDTTTSKFNEVTTDVDGVKANVDGVKANVETVKASVSTAQSDIDATRTDLKRAMGDMGVMSGLIATNSKDLAALRALGERNYIEFDMTKQSAKKVGDITLTLKKADAKRNRFTMDVLADDRRVEKKDKTINEPVQLYVAGSMQPYEIVVNTVTKDRITGYLSTPKVKMARR